MRVVEIGLVLLYTSFQISAVYQDCPDVIITSEYNKTGNFSSPQYPRNYPGNLKCLIKFVGGPNERVQINFTDFRLDGFPNELIGVSTGCTNDYIDIYTEIEHPDHDILELPLQGRYCGNDITRLPHLLMSSKQTLIITFDSDDDGKTARGFLGTYEFISDEPYNMGIPASFGCGWTVNGEEKSEGYIMAPYYPAVYPDGLNCYYQLQGVSGQRIRLEFLDFDLYSGGDHCPYDELRIHDGSTSADPLIGIYCSRIEGLVLYSTGHEMYLQFRTRQGRPSIEPVWGDKVITMSGFKARYTFSDEFVNLGFIVDGEHVQGSECDVRIKSQGESSGVIVSPGFPNSSPSNTTCHYFIDGLIDQDNLEKVVLTFEEAFLPGYLNRCKEGSAYVATYLYGQKATTSRPDHFLCDLELPKMLTSHDPRLTLKYTTNSVQPGAMVGFKAKYQFTMDYAIEGTPANPIASSDCHFIYRSSSDKSGKLNSPRYPSAYPNDITCTYELVAQPYEFIMISFDKFDLEPSPVGDDKCSRDSISSVSMIPQQGNTTLDIQMGKYCGTAYPGPIVSEWLTERMILTFSSNSAVTERGFKAKYEFISTLQRFQYCGGNITEGGSGEITPPNYPLKYNTKTVCDWYIYRRNPRAQIKIKFEHFDIEGTMEEGCQGAVLRIYTAEEYKVDYEACGQEAPKQHIISQNGFIRIKYISPSKTYGKTGFKVTWTEVIQGATKLSNMSILYIIMGVVILLLVIVLAIICVCVRCSVKKSASRRNSSRKSSSKPSDIQLPMIESDIVYNDRLSKTPMLPKSVSINSSTFSPYDPMLQDGIYKGQQLAPVPDNVFEQSTLSSKYSYNPSLHTSLHRPQSDKYFSSPTHQKYDMDSCLTSL